MSDNLTVVMFTDLAEDIQLCNHSKKEVAEAQEKIVRIIRDLWQHYEASQGALARALRENRIHAEALEIAMDTLRKCKLGSLDINGHCYDAFYGLTKVEDKLRELEVQP